MFTWVLCVCVCVLTRLTRSDLRYQSTNFFHRHCVADSKHLQVLFIGGALLTWGHRHGNVCCTPNLLRSTHIKAPPSDRSIIHRRPCDWIVTGLTPIRDGPLLASCHFLLFVLLFFFYPDVFLQQTHWSTTASDLLQDRCNRSECFDIYFLFVAWHHEGCRWEQS